jgi:hypothetical protein
VNNIEKLVLLGRSKCSKFKNPLSSLIILESYTTKYIRLNDKTIKTHFDPGNESSLLEYKEEGENHE